MPSRKEHSHYREAGRARLPVAHRHTHLGPHEHLPRRGLHLTGYGFQNLLFPTIEQAILHFGRAEGIS